MKSTNVECAHEGCTCPGLPELAANNNEMYCSDACADGVGCHHPDCNCANTAAAEKSGN